MRRLDWKVLLGISLVVLSAFFYLVHFFIFRDAHHIFIYLVGDVAFVFVEVLLVTLIIHRLLSQREKRTKLEKLNMVIGTFFSEAGTELLAAFSDADPNLDSIREKLIVDTEWTDADFLQVRRDLRKYHYDVQIPRINLSELHRFLAEERDFLVRLLENPVLLEHEKFTDLLRAVFHLAEELANREEIQGLPDSNLQHLSGDVRRAYVLLAQQWLDYMKYLQGNYPYLFSLAMRTNPFDRKATAIIS